MEGQYTYLIIAGIAIAIILIAILALFLYKKYKDKTGSNINSAFLDALFLYIGGINNILGVEVEQARLKMEVKDLELVDLEQLKTLTDKGIFVTGNVVKALFKDDALTIKKEIEKRM